MPGTTESSIKDVFNDFSSGQVERVKKTKDYAFVHFTTREAAEMAMEAVDQAAGSSASGKFHLDGSPLEICWSKPVDKQNYNIRKQLTKVLGNGMGGPLPAIGYE